MCGRRIQRNEPKQRGQIAKPRTKSAVDKTIPSVNTWNSLAVAVVAAEKTLEEKDTTRVIEAMDIVAIHFFQKGPVQWIFWVARAVTFG